MWDEAATGLIIGVTLIIDALMWLNSMLMPKQVTLDVDDARQLREILDFIEVDQKTVSEEAGVSRPWLSGLLKGDLTKSVDAQMFESVARFLTQRINALSKDKLTDDRAQRAMTFLRRFHSAAAKLAQQIIDPPGSPVLIDAPHYIEREADADYLEGLQRLPFTMMVRGPAQCGKSSLLARLKQKAEAKGIQSLLFDPLSSMRRIESQGETEGTAVALSEQLQEEWGIEPPSEGPISSISKLARWLRKELARTASKPRLLIMDDLASLGPHEAADWMRMFVRYLHNERGPSHIQLSMAVGLTRLYGPEFERELLVLSSIVHWWPRIDVDWFTRPQVKEFVKKVRSDIDAGRIFELVGGQPYLTHSATWYGNFRKSLEEWSESKSRESEKKVISSAPYRRHLSAIKLGILGRSMKLDSETRELLQTFVAVCNGDVVNDKDPDHITFFVKKIKLLKENGEPTLGIYKLFAQEFERMLGER